MILAAATDLVRFAVRVVRNADSGLASSAAANARDCVHDQRIRDLDDARTLRDLRGVAPSARPSARSGASYPARYQRATTVSDGSGQPGTDAPCDVALRLALGLAP